MNDKEVARLVRPENKLKKKIGMDINMREILHPDVLQPAQQMIYDQKDQFVALILESIKQMEAAYLDLEQQTGTEVVALALKVVVQQSSSVRDRAGTFGYHLGSDIAKSLARYCDTSSAKNSHLALVIRKHLDGLQIVFRDNVTDSGGIIGMELNSSIRKLVEKYPAVG
jgi:hypothetical protein